ncbi:NAD(P)-dependent oxidoreductase [Candidatus Tisiphia endosymbiont of Temnostethus pusillus]|uniref:NAD(P)-dependent oxidoreductase n=1 Tax=Candidatus Tisiphia endosymbiont of Temnostethus pusillus TaxID=3139335 RepID=UPI0035C8F37C
MIKTLILDKIHESGINLLRTFSEVEEGWTYTYEQIFHIIEDYDAIIIKSNNRITRGLILKASNLKVIGRAGSGVDNVDFESVKQRGIQVITSPEGNAVSVAEFIIGLILMFSHNILKSHNAARANDFRRDMWTGRNLSNMKVGVLGLGVIGSCLVRKLEHLSLKTYGFDYKQRSTHLDRVTNFELYNNLEVFFSNIDILSINIPLCQSTTHIISRYYFSIMKKGIILINTARGKIIDNEALIDAIDQGIISYAGLDVLEPDPPFHIHPLKCTYAHPLINHPKVFYTPHIAAGTDDALSEVAINLVNKMKKVLDSEQNIT